MMLDRVRGSKIRLSSDARRYLSAFSTDAANRLDSAQRPPWRLFTPATATPVQNSFYADGNKSRAAEILGIGRTTLYRKSGP